MQGTLAVLTALGALGFDHKGPPIDPVYAGPPLQVRANDTVPTGCAGRVPCLVPGAGLWPGVDYGPHGWWTAGGLYHGGPHAERRTDRVGYWDPLYLPVDRAWPTPDGRWPDSGALARRVGGASFDVYHAVPGPPAGGGWFLQGTTILPPSVPTTPLPEPLDTGIPPAPPPGAPEAPAVEAEIPTPPAPGPVP